MNYFRTIGGWLIFTAVVGLEILFSAGVWYMISVGMYPALGTFWSAALGFLVAPIIGVMALVVFVYGHRLKQIILEWEAVHGSLYDEDAQVYHNKRSYTRIVDAMKIMVLIADTGGILYRLLQEVGVSWLGKALLFIVFEAFAVCPWLIGTLVHIVANRPAYAIRRDVQYIREVSEAEQELAEITESRKRKTPPATAPRQPVQIPQRQSPKSGALQPYQAEPESVSVSPNGKAPTA